MSAGCQNCYAATGSVRNPKVLGKWGPNGTRVVASDSAWRQVERWAKAAKTAGEYHRIFPSLCDPFEDWSGPMSDSRGVELRCCRMGDCVAGRLREAQAVTNCHLCQQSTRPLTMDDVRRRLFSTIVETDGGLNWLLLTKRPENIKPMLQRMEGFALSNMWDEINCYPDCWSGIWWGVSVEDQAAADERIPLLLQVPAVVRFLSVEPLLGPVDLRLDQYESPGWFEYRNNLLQWCIIGGESGPGARPCDLSWVRSLVAQCRAANVKAFVKQLGSCAGDPVNGVAGRSLQVPEEAAPLISKRLRDPKGGDWLEWEEGLRVREFPTT